MKKRLAMFTLVSLLFPASAWAGEGCYEDPFYSVGGTAHVNSAVFVRSGPCVATSQVLETAAAGSDLAVLAYTDQWHLVKLPSGTTGWIWDGLMSVSESGARVETAFEALPVGKGTAAPMPAPAATGTTTSSSLVSTLKGRILLQVQQHGEAWYLNPADGKRYYMKDGPTAYEMMRKFGLGISSANFAKLVAGDATLKAQLKGKIVLEVERHGEAHYILPTDGSINYLRDGAAAYQIMRELSLGITDADLAKIPASEFVPIASTTPAPPAPSTPVVSTGEISSSAFQKGAIPSGVDLVAANEYWLAKINALRAEKGLRLLVLDQRWVDTATEWASYMGENDTMTHTRPDGKTMHQWIDTKGLDFTVRNSLPDGWVTNYFTENISWNLGSGTQEELERTLDETLAWYLAEGPAGAHYRTVYHPDWNSVGAGFYFAPQENGRYKIFQAFHYGSLVLN
jgi:uncharacterized protein YkwD/uncharacterized protein YgiM (DUF1202 family)